MLCSSISMDNWKLTVFRNDAQFLSLGTAQDKFPGQWPMLLNPAVIKLMYPILCVKAHASLLGHHRAPGWASCIVQQLPASCTWRISSITWLLTSLTCMSLIIRVPLPILRHRTPWSTPCTAEVQWLSLHASTVAGTSLIPGWGTEVLLFYFVAKHRKISKEIIKKKKKPTLEPAYI